jgi:dTDP-4-amino-4,6-dideoxygalactose transaminase
LPRRPRRIQFDPALSPSLLAGRANGGQVPAVLRGPAVEWLFCGTAAVYRAIRSLDLKGSDRVLMPDYNCGIEVNAVLQAGAEVTFYRVRRDATIDLEDLEKKAVPPVKAIFIIHYFGFPHRTETILAVARSRGLFLIEDCAHALYSEQDGLNLGTSGDLGIFSPRKVLPLLDGGALLYNGPSARCREPLTAPDRSHTVREVLSSLGQRSARSGNPLVRGTGRFLRVAARAVIADDAAEKPLSRCGSEDFDSVKRRLNWSMSLLSRSILERIDHEEVVERRRRNYLHLLRRLPRGNVMTPLYPDLPRGVCPLYLPMVVRERDRLYELMKTRGVESFRYWMWKHPETPGSGRTDAEALRRDLLALPVHQDLDEEDLGVMEEVISESIASL